MLYNYTYFIHQLIYSILIIVVAYYICLLQWFCVIMFSKVGVQDFTQCRTPRREAGHDHKRNQNSSQFRDWIVFLAYIANSLTAARSGREGVLSITRYISLWLYTWLRLVGGARAPLAPPWLRPWTLFDLCHACTVHILCACACTWQTTFTTSVFRQPTSNGVGSFIECDWILILTI